jgi:[glutamine synthetase] adenylyltransferase / [glutamine synthetase]-adenylyl-L-tyrosine phosphorylase
LNALTEAGVVTASSRDGLTEAYVFFREVEHRIQMLEDAQTHQVPADAETRARVAALAGFATLTEFEAALIEHRGIVAEIDHQLFGRHDSLADPLGSLIFTGVEDSPETLNTIGKLGFANPAYVSQTIRGWHHGRIRAMRSERARELLTLLTPRLLRAFSGAGEPDQAFARFASFFAGLNAGVQVLALLDARPALLDLLARLFTLAPRLADELALRPALLDALIEPRFAAPLSQEAPGTRRTEVLGRLREESSFEGKLNAARRFQREEAFRIGVQLLEGIISAAEAGVAHAELAEACVAAMAQAASQEVQRTLGPDPGRVVVLGLGKFGGRELAEGSDLDLMLVYDAPEDVGAIAGDYYTKLTQRLISALSAPTEEGSLYEIDTKLRPSGSKGPVAVRLSSFERYYGDEAWTWELLALTRLRAVAGDESLAKRVEDIARATLSRPRDRAKTMADVADMRALMDRERPSKTVWDLKLAPGGFVDIEFIAQALQLAAGALARDVLSSNTGEALSKLAAAGLLAPDVAARLGSAWRLWSDLQQMLRVCVAGEFDPETAPPPLRARLGHVTRLESFDRLQSEIRLVQQDVRADFLQIVGPVRDGNGEQPRS